MKIQRPYCLGASLLLTLVLAAGLNTTAQSINGSSVSPALYRQLASLDSTLFANVYTCNPSKNITFFTEDLEFYHDKGGLTRSRKAFMESLDKGFCQTIREYQLRRELIAGTLKVYILNNYGAVQTGEHRFYQVRAGEPEQLVETAKFTHIWQNTGGEWRIARVISYDHQPAN